MQEETCAPPEGEEAHRDGSGILRVDAAFGPLAARRAGGAC